MQSGITALRHAELLRSLTPASRTSPTYVSVLKDLQGFLLIITSFIVDYLIDSVT